MRNRYFFFKKCSKFIKKFDKILRKHVDPEKMDLKAKSDQKLLIDYYGGREKIAKKKVASATPAPI